MWRVLLKSRFFLAGAVVFLVFLLFLLGQELRKKYEIGKEIRDLQNKISEFEGKNREYESLINYFSTPEFRERQARTLLNLQKPGEFAVALPNREEALSTDEENRANVHEPNFLKWWNYFFGKKS